MRGSPEVALPAPGRSNHLQAPGACSQQLSHPSPCPRVLPSPSRPVRSLPPPGRAKAAAGPHLPSLASLLCPCMSKARAPGWAPRSGTAGRPARALLRGALPARGATTHTRVSFLKKPKPTNQPTQT